MLSHDFFKLRRLLEYESLKLLIYLYESHDFKNIVNAINMNISVYYKHQL